MNRGYVKVWRKTRDTGLNCVQLGLWTSCLLESAHKPRTVFVASQQVELQAGQFVFGRSEWARRLGLSDKTLRSALAALIKRGMILASTRASKFTVYSVVNWALYQVCEQCEGPAEGPTTGPAEGQQRASRGPHIKNDKNEENGKKKEKPSFVENSDEFRLATVFYHLILANKPDFKKPNLQKWAEHVGYMIRIDKRTPEDIQAVMEWVQADNAPRGNNGFCWAVNVLSTAKLREKFDTIEMKMPGGKANGGGFDWRGVL